MVQFDYGESLYSINTNRLTKLMKSRAKELCKPPFTSPGLEQIFQKYIPTFTSQR